MLKRLFSYSGDKKKNGYISTLLILLSTISNIAVFVTVYKMIQIVLSKELDTNKIVVFGSVIIVFYFLKAYFYAMGFKGILIYLHTIFCAT